jgi:hypothetical protein
MKTVTVGIYFSLVSFRIQWTPLRKIKVFQRGMAEFFAANACEQPALYKQRAGCICMNPSQILAGRIFRLAHFVVLL